MMTPDYQKEGGAGVAALPSQINEWRTGSGRPWVWSSAIFA